MEQRIKEDILKQLKTQQETKFKSIKTTPFNTSVKYRGTDT
jgi:hypothetical protein